MSFILAELRLELAARNQGQLSCHGNILCGVNLVETFAKMTET